MEALWKVLTKKTGLYQVPNWSYSQKTQKRAWEEELGDEGVLSEVQEKNQLSMKSQTGDMAKKTKKRGINGGLREVSVVGREWSS